MKNLALLVLAAVLVSACSDLSNDKSKGPVDFNKPQCTLSAIGDTEEKGADQDVVGAKTNYVTPTRKLALNEWPQFSDDLDFENMNLAIDRQLKRFNEINLSTQVVEFGGQKFSGLTMRNSLREFKNSVNAYLRCKNKNLKADCLLTLNNFLRQKFNVYVPDLRPGDTRYGESNPVLFTGYYTPTLQGSVSPTGDKPYAIYKKPSTKVADATRQEIDFGRALAGKNLELFYTDSLFDLYLLHVQGGGRVLVPGANNKMKQYYLTYDGTNGHSWTFISKYMIEKGYVANGSIDSQRRYLNSFPTRQEEIFATCPSYVYFKVTSEPPHGSDMVPLTDNRSIATDTNHYLFKGTLAFVEARRPADPYDAAETCAAGQFKSFARFYLDQDTGGAIRGKGRVDLYFGENPYAEVAAYNTVQRGNLYFLILK